MCYHKKIAYIYKNGHKTEKRYIKYFIKDRRKTPKYY